MTKAKTKTTEETKTTEQVIYVGPTIKNVVKQHTVFINGLPAILEEKAKELPAIKKLVVPVSKLMEVRKQIEQTGTAYNVFYEKVRAYAEGGK